MPEHKPSAPKKPVGKGSRRISAEQIVLLLGVLGFLLFLWIVVFGVLPLLSGRPLPRMVVQAAATRGFALPPTWTPGPTPEIVTTPTATPVFDGAQPTRMYTPRATSLPGLPQLVFPLPPRADVVDLARIMEGESRFDQEAAYYVGWVAKNRLRHPGYGDTYARVSSGFFGYRADMRPHQDFIKLAQKVIRAKKDPTHGSLYALARIDIIKLGVPPERADVTIGEWYFFKTWPVNRRS
ncbi:MAG: hypothetical protein D6768_20730 [Chloroflexi bacterium]|nr:MAG: hypothetical protein D6768_20730 [Chloroflexota bacterium]